MTTGAVALHHSPPTQERDSFWHLVHAEWTKFRTVRGWVIAVLVTIAAITAFVFVATDVSHSCVGPGGPSACPAQPSGPGGVPVLDAFYFAHQPVTGNGSITVQVTSLTGQVEVGQAGNGAPHFGPGLQPWSKAGIIIKENTTQGSAYAAMMVTGSHGARMQWDETRQTRRLSGFANFNVDFGEDRGEGGSQHQRHGARSARRHRHGPPTAQREEPATWT